MQYVSDKSQLSLEQSTQDSRDKPKNSYTRLLCYYESNIFMARHFLVITCISLKIFEGNFLS